MAMKTIFVLLIVVFCRLDLFAGGSITGQVTSKSDGAPLVGANVLLKGSFRGASTDVEGKFRLAEITPGSYTLTFSLVGYQRETRTDLVVEEDKETVVNVSMTQVALPTDQVVVTASRREQSLEEVPVSISVMDAAEIQYRNAYSIEDAVRYVPGVNLTGGQINIRGSSGYSRGAGSRVLMLLDGVPFIAGDTGELIFESIAIGQVDRIEVVKGASSALYGSSALGGVINIITKPIPEISETYLRTSGGLYSKPTFSQWNWSGSDRSFGSVALGHTFHLDDIGVALGLSRQVNDGYMQNSNIKRSNVYLKTRKDFASANSLTMNFGLLFQERGQFQYWRNLDSALIPPFVQRDDRVESLRYFLSGSYNDAFADNFLFTAKALWNHNDWKNMSGHDFWIAGWDTLPNGRFSETLESLSNGFRLDASSTWLVNDEHTITFGVSGNYDVVTSASKLFGSHKGWSAAFFAQDEWRLTKELSLTVGGRFDVQRVGLTESGPQVNPKVALAYNPVEGTSVRASFGRGFRIPSIAEAFVALDLGGGINTLPNADLKAERSYSYEVGLAQRVSDFASLDVAFFRSDYSNLIEPTPFIDTTGNLKIQWRNTPSARVQGFETSIKLGLFSGDLLYNLGYTYVYPEDLSPDDPLFPRPNKILPYRPRHVFFTGLYGRLGILRAGVDFRYSSRVDRVFSAFGIIIPNANERVDILVTDFRIGADFTSLGVPLSAMFNVNNAFRYNYVELTANINPPRNYVVALEARL